MARCFSCAANLSPLFLLVVFTTINILNYVDRGIVPGVPESLGAFIRESEHFPNGTSTDAYLGGLQSEGPALHVVRTHHQALTSRRSAPPVPRPHPTGSFIGGYSVASISFGHLVHKYPPFKLMSIGLVIWVVAVVIRSVWGAGAWGVRCRYCTFQTVRGCVRAAAWRPISG